MMKLPFTYRFLSPVQQARAWFNLTIDADCQRGEIYIGPHGVIWHRLWEGENISPQEDIWIGWHCEGDEANPEWWFTYGATVEDLVRCWLCLPFSDGSVKTGEFGDVEGLPPRPTLHAITLQQSSARSDTEDQPPPPEGEPPSVTEEREQLAAWERKEKEMKDAGIPIPPPPVEPIPESAKRLKYPWLLDLM